MLPDEARTLGPLLASVVAAIKGTVHADRVYTWSTMDRHPHLHIWLLPWWQGSTTRGPEYLVNSVHGGGATEHEAVKAAHAMREVLAGPAVSRPTGPS
jgi:hypothetical protein